jgi:FHS family L-fucose permease-like MFS transporter
MYPTIYVLALPPDPKLATPGGTLLCMAVVGGAVIPMLTGLLADRIGLAASFGLPALCYAFIAAFARACRGAGI